jgi:predicted Zn finger-like uncharacterized protein
MLIVCPSCATSYHVNPSTLGATGRSVRCVRCKSVWYASNPDALAAIGRAHREDVAAYTTSTTIDTLVDPQAAAPQAEIAIFEAASPLVDVPTPEPETAAELPPAEVLVRDDRGPAPLREPPPERRAPPEIEDAPALAPTIADPAAAAVAVSVAEDVETVAARRIRRRPQRRARWPVPRLATAILALLAINAGLIAFRADIARWLPQTASFYAAIGLPVNLRGLVFADLVTRKDTQDGVQMLLVEGVIKSTGSRTAEVPRIRFAVRNAGGQEIYSWTALPARNVLAPGGVMPFRSRLASPPADTHEVLVRFFNRRDVVAGIK